MRVKVKHLLNVDNQLLSPGQEVDLKVGLAEKLKAVGLVEEVEPKTKAVKKRVNKK